MKLATIGKDYASRSVALVDGDRVFDLAPLLDRSGHGWRDLGDVLTDGPDALAGLREIASAVDQRDYTPVADANFLVPVPRPNHVLCVAANYRAHVLETGTIEDAPRNETSPWFFNKPQNSLNPHGAPIKLPATGGRNIDWEAELGVIIGSRASAVSVEDALQYVAGYTVVNDVSARIMDVPQRTRIRPRDGFHDWLHGKWFDTFCCVGPWMTTSDEIPDPATLEVALTLNGTEMQRAGTKEMIFSTSELISFISNIVTLEPGDIIATGTPAGTGKAHGRFLTDGDEVIASVSSIGSLRNTVTADA